MQNDNTRLNGGGLSLRRDVSGMLIHKRAYNQAENPFNIKHGIKKTLKKTLEDEMQQFYLPRNGKLVTQLPRGINFAYDLHLGRSRDHWKGPIKEYNVKIEKR